MKIEEARRICRDFALKHRVVFEDKGEVGLGRECVGFRDGTKYIDHNPCTSGGNYEPIAKLACRDAFAPDDVNSYHKHDCLAVLGRDDEAIIGLAKWVQKIEAAGEVAIVEYETGATGIQAVFSGITGRAVLITKPRVSESNDATRKEDMSNFGRLIVHKQDDGDVVVVVAGRDSLGEAVTSRVEFCSPGAGGGRSPHTIKALRELALAIERDNTENPTS